MTRDCLLIFFHPNVLRAGAADRAVLNYKFSTPCDDLLSILYLRLACHQLPNGDVRPTRWDGLKTTVFVKS